jgi:hypothetical protein
MCLNSIFLKQKKITSLVDRCIKSKNWMPNANPVDLHDNKAFGEHWDKIFRVWFGKKLHVFIKIIDENAYQEIMHCLLNRLELFFFPNSCPGKQIVHFLLHLRFSKIIHHLPSYFYVKLFEKKSYWRYENLGLLFGPLFKQVIVNLN